MIIYDDVRVSRWFGAKMGDENPAVVPAIGVERNGVIVAAAAFDAAEPNNIYAHIASDVFPVPSDLLRAISYYAYKQCGVERLTFRIDEANENTVKFVEKMGAELEGRLKRAYGDRDTLLYVLWKDAPFLQRLG